MKIHILNGALPFGSSQGKLNDTMSSFAQKTLDQLGHEVTMTVLRDGYDIKKEVAAIKNADTVIYHFPGWWMDVPWILKRYIDEVFNAGKGVLYKDDGRTHTDPEKKYGSGGLSQGKNYMFATSWNAPLESFTDPQQFFRGFGIDGLLFHLHRAHSFLGMVPLETFLLTDVMKDPDVPKAIQDYGKHLTSLFGSKS